MRRCSDNTGASLFAATVECHELVAALEAQDVSEIVGFAVIEGERCAAEIALEEEARRAVLRTCHGVKASIDCRPGWYISTRIAGTLAVESRRK